MLNVSYAGCSNLSLVILVQFTLEMGVAAKNRQKIHKNLFFGVQGHSRSLLLVPIKIQCGTSY